MHAFDGAPIDIDPEQAARMLADGATMIDVREAYERRAGHIAGSEHVELTRLAAAAATIDRDGAVVFYCRVGGRSTMAAEAFRSSGYDAYNLAGGILAWVAAGLPLTPEGGHVADH
jgi:hydroxyacylglutathione hydrolase/adenylyltransferase/sulfurtransferase